MISYKAPLDFKASGAFWYNCDSGQILNIYKAVALGYGFFYVLEIGCIIPKVMV
jgi:hypothetical protein